MRSYAPGAAYPDHQSNAMQTSSTLYTKQCNSVPSLMCELGLAECRTTRKVCEAAHLL